MNNNERRPGRFGRRAFGLIVLLALVAGILIVIFTTLRQERGVPSHVDELDEEAWDGAIPEMIYDPSPMTEEDDAQGGFEAEDSGGTAPNLYDEGAPANDTPSVPEGEDDDERQ